MLLCTLTDNSKPRSDSKLDPKNEVGVFLGFATKRNMYRAHNLSCPKQAAAAEAARAPGPTSSRLAGPRLLQGSSSEDAGSLSHLHTDRPLGRPRGPLLQQHVGLLVAAPPRLCAPQPCSSSKSSTATPSR